MHKINNAAARVLADDLRAAFGSIDTSLQDTARLVGTFMETATSSDLAPSSTQRALRSMGDLISKAIDGRGDLIAAQRVMVSIKENSNLEVVDIGCWQGRLADAAKAKPEKVQTTA